MKRHPKRTRRSKPFVGLPKELLNHQSVTMLSHAEFRVLVLIAKEYYGSNNGALGVTAAQAAQQGIRSKNTHYAALRKLEARGLIAMTYPASRVPPRPAMYEITWQPCDETRYSFSTRTPSFAYRKWCKELEIEGQ